MSNAWHEPVVEQAVHTLNGSPPIAIVCAVLMPHAPILVPAISGGRGVAAAATYEALRQAAACVIRRQPESVVVISPHSPRQSGAFGLWSETRIEGSFAQFNAPEVRVSLPNDRPLAKAISDEAESRNVNTWLIRHHPLDHGALVPLWFLAQAAWAGPTVLISLNYQDEGGLTRLGEAIAAAANTRHRRVAIIASGDMSHRLTANAPCGFHPQAHQFDESFIQLLRTGDYRGLQTIDPELRELAAEDAVDSTVVAAAAVDWKTTGHEVLSYEGPFGVGYGVAILFAKELNSPAMNKTNSVADVSAGGRLPDLARRAVEAALSGSPEFPPAANNKYLATRRGVFVTLRGPGGELRGCVGTPLPVCEDLVAETWRAARLAAFHDGRFPPVTAEELPDLHFDVSVLHSIEDVSSLDELDPQRYGVIVSTADKRCGILLPCIEGIDTAEQQLCLAREKGRIGSNETMRLRRFQVDHFVERVCNLNS